MGFGLRVLVSGFTVGVVLGFGVRGVVDGAGHGKAFQSLPGNRLVESLPVPGTSIARTSWCRTDSGPLAVSSANGDS